MKVKCVGYKTGERYFTCGKIYEWSEDSFVNDRGYDYNAGLYKAAKGTDPKKWELSYWYEFEVVERESKIVITADGRTTTAKFYEDKKVIKIAKAVCSYDDTYDFEIGAKIAFDRLVGNAEKGGKAEEKQEETFAAHLFSLFSGADYGSIGAETNYKDVIGRPLFVGDTVDLYDAGNNLLGERAVVYEDNRGAFVMGIRDDCMPRAGKIGYGWKVIKKRSYEDVPNGEKVGDISYFKVKSE